MDELRETVELLEQAYEAAKRQVLQDNKWLIDTYDIPEAEFNANLAKDPSGRYILLDALVALTNARAALVKA